MEAVILAVGVGKRLLPLTDRKPKMLLEVGGKPLLTYQLESLRRYFDMQSIYIVVWYCGKLVEGIQRVLKDKKLADRLEENTSKDAHLYKWDKRAERILAFIEGNIADIKAELPN